MEKQERSLIETAVQISLIAGNHWYYSGNMVEDMNTIVGMAEAFEKKYANVDWQETTLDWWTEVETFTKQQLKLVNKIKFVPSPATNAWDAVEIAGIVDDGTEANRVEDENDNPDYWSVYLHQVAGGVDCVADVPTEEQAKDLKLLLVNAVRSFMNNPHLLQDIPIPNKNLLVEVILNLTIYKQQYTESQVGYKDCERLITELSKLLEQHQPVKLLTAFSREAGAYLNEKGIQSMIRLLPQCQNRFQGIDILEFNTQGELDAYVRGVEDGNGWDKPNYEQVK